MNNYEYIYFNSNSEIKRRRKKKQTGSWVLHFVLQSSPERMFVRLLVVFFSYVRPPGLADLALDQRKTDTGDIHKQMIWMELEPGRDNSGL